MNTDGIRVDTDSITIDLNGFYIARSGCETNACEPVEGIGDGISGPGSPGGALTEVRNGSIRGVGRYGVSLNEKARISNLTITDCGVGGIFASSPGNEITGNLVAQNLGTGITAGSESIVTGNRVSGNEGNGITCFIACSISKNLIYLSGAWGIFAQGGGADVDGNVIVEKASGGTGAIRGANGVVVYRNNTISRQAGLSITITNAVNAGGNVCNGSLTCP